MLYYDRTDKNKGTYPAKNNSSKEYMICCYWLFNYLIKNALFYWFKCQDSVCTRCHDLPVFCFHENNTYTLHILLL